MDTATHILTRVAVELPATRRRFTVRDLELRVISTAYRLYSSRTTYATHRQAKRAFALAPAIAPGSSHTSYRQALLKTLT